MIVYSQYHYHKIGNDRNPAFKEPFQQPLRSGLGTYKVFQLQKRRL